VASWRKLVRQKKYNGTKKAKHPHESHLVFGLRDAWAAEKMRAKPAAISKNQNARDFSNNTSFLRLSFNAANNREALRNHWITIVFLSAKGTTPGGWLGLPDSDSSRFHRSCSEKTHHSTRKQSTSKKAKVRRVFFCIATEYAPVISSVVVCQGPGLPLLMRQRERGSV